MDKSSSPDTPPAAWAAALIEAINNHILNGDLYHALKEAKKLIVHEGELLDDARRQRIKQSLGKQTGRKSA